MYVTRSLGHMKSMVDYCPKITCKFQFSTQTQQYKLLCTDKTEINIQTFFPHTLEWLNSLSWNLWKTQLFSGPSFSQSPPCSAWLTGGFNQSQRSQGEVDSSRITSCLKPPCVRESLDESKLLGFSPYRSPLVQKNTLTCISKRIKISRILQQPFNPPKYVFRYTF